MRDGVSAQQYSQRVLGLLQIAFQLSAPAPWCCSAGGGLLHVQFRRHTVVEPQLGQISGFLLQL